MISTSPSSTWSTQSSCRRFLQHVNNTGRFSATLAPCHQWRPSPCSGLPEIQLQPLVARVQLSTANGDNIKMHGYKDADVIVGNISMYVCFYICDVSAPILGVNKLVSNNVELNLRNFNDSYLQQHGQQELLQYIGPHFYIPAILTEANKLNVVWQTVVQEEFFSANVHYSQLSGILTSDIAIEDSYVEAHPATALRSPTTPSPQEKH